MARQRSTLALAGLVFGACSEYTIGKPDVVSDTGTAPAATEPATTPPETTPPETTPPTSTTPSTTGTPDILVDPYIVNFGGVDAGVWVDAVVRISNVGDAPLALGLPTLEHDGAFRLDAPSLVDIPPGVSVDAFVEYTPLTSLDLGTILIPSNDPDTPVAEVQLRGSLAEPDVPTAVCSVDPSRVEAIHQTATWIGRDSFDPAGRPLTYQWRLTSIPAGSAPTMPAGSPTSPDRPGFRPDVVGFYQAELVVTNDLGVSSPPCYAELEAIPAADLWVEMFWAERGDDMDLHLVRGTGSLRTNQDCYYQNCVGSGLSWGPAGASGDPVLDLDDVPGRGPENINIDLPENTQYHVWVHDYPGSTYRDPNEVTVRIYLGGVLTWEDTRPITGEDQDVRFATIDWATRTVTPR
jgi:hypothetical protein